MLHSPSSRLRSWHDHRAEAPSSSHLTGISSGIRCVPVLFFSLGCRWLPHHEYLPNKGESN